MSVNGKFKVDVEVDQHNNNLIAHVSLKRREEVGLKHIYTSDVRGELARQGWNVSECVSNATLNNVADGSLQAAWIFSLGAVKEEKVNPTEKKTSEKTDKKEETKKKISPTNRRRRSTKNTPKK